MSLTSPAWLALLALLPLVVILHAVAVRWRARPVSSLVFWEDVLREKRTSLRVRRLLRNLSLFLELAAVAALAVALAAPRVSRPGLAGAGDTVLVIDATASMQAREAGRTRFDLARARARDVLAGLRRGARVAVVAVAEGPRVVLPFTADRAEARRAVDALRVTDAPGDFGAAAAFAAALREPSRGDQVVLVTDGAFASLGGLDPAAPWLHVLPVGSARDNVGITALAFRRSLSGAGFEMFLSVTNAGASAVRVPLAVSAGGTPVVTRTLDIAAGASASVSLPWTGPASGRVEARIDPADAFPLDDRAYAVFSPSRTLRVLVAGDSTFFLQKALSSLPGVSVRAVSTPPSAAEAADASWDVAVYDDVQPPLLTRGAAIYFSCLPPGLPLRASGILSLPAVTGWDRSSALLDDVPLAGVAIGSALDLEAGAGFRVVARSRDRPLVLTWDLGGPRAIVVAFAPERSDFPLRPGFPVFMANALAWFFPAWLSVQAEQVQAGRPRAIPAAEGTEVTVTDPAGARTPITAGAAGVEFLATQRTGFYTVDGGSGAPEFAVSLASAGETDLRPRLEGTGGPGGAGGAPSGPASVPVWPLLAALALAAVLLEWLVSVRAARGAAG